MSLTVGWTAENEAMRRHVHAEVRRFFGKAIPPLAPPSAQRMRWMAEDEWLTAQWNLAGLDPRRLEWALMPNHNEEE